MANGNVTHLYTMDFLSLISFAMGIVGVVLAVFFGWLSWKFYVESSRISEKVTGQVAEIRTELSSVRADLSGIVQNVVSRLINTSGQSSGAAVTDIEEKLNELTAKVEQAAGVDTSNIREEVSKIKDLVSSFAQQGQREKALWSLAETTAPMSYSMTLDSGSGGDVEIEIRRPISVATVPVRVNALAPEREVSATVVMSPYAIDAGLKATVKFIKPGFYALHVTGRGDLAVGRYRVSLDFESKK